MRSLTLFPVLVCICFILVGCNGSDSSMLRTGTQPLISPERLVQAMEQGGVNLIDVRKPEKFRGGHIPHAVNIWRPQIQSRDYPFGGMRASRSELETLFGGLGLDPSKPFVLYDAKGNVDAARLWWLLRINGVDDVLFLGGGLVAWKATGAVVDTAISHRIPGKFVFREPENQAMVASTELVAKAIKDEEWVILDTRSEQEFTGEVQKKGAFRAGHIPGSLWLDYIENFDPKTHRFYPKDQLEKKYRELGITPDKKIIVYCQ